MLTRRFLSVAVKDIANGEEIDDAVKDVLKDVPPLLANVIGGQNGSTIAKAVEDVRISYHSPVEMYKLNPFV